MDLNKFLEERLAAIRSMPTERFEEICIQHGYTPERKAEFELKQNLDAEGFVQINNYKLVVGKDGAANDNQFIECDEFEFGCAA